MALKEMEIGSRKHLLDLLSELRCMQLDGNINFISGSFDLDLEVRCKFRTTKDGLVWELYCMDDKGGSGYLRRA